MRSALRPHRACQVDQSWSPLVACRGRNSDGRDGKRTGNTGQQRSLAVNNGHSKTTTDQERNALTRLGEELRVGVRFPPAPREFWRICPAQGICALVVSGPGGRKRATQNVDTARRRPGSRQPNSRPASGGAPPPRCVSVVRLSVAQREVEGIFGLRPLITPTSTTEGVRPEQP